MMRNWRWGTWYILIYPNTPLTANNTYRITWSTLGIHSLHLFMFKYSDFLIFCITQRTPSALRFLLASRLRRSQA